MNVINCPKKRLPATLVILVTVLAMVPVSAKMLFQITPEASISEEYSDNYLRESANKQEEFVTTYAAGLTLAVMAGENQMFLTYTPTYREYRNLDERDGLNHVVSMDARFSPTKHTDLKARAYSDGKSGNYQGETQERNASLSGTTQAGEHTQLTYSHHYSRSFDQQLRTGIYKQHTLNTTQAALNHQYGKKDTLKTAFIYETDTYQSADSDEYKKIEPSVTNAYWFSPLYGMETNLDYQKKDFKQPGNDLDTYAGHMKFMRAFSKNMDGYLRYRHSYTDSETYTHNIFHPSFGMDWDVSEDSGISLGLGLLFHDRSDGANSTDPFVDFNAFKRFEFNPRTTLTLTGSSDYSSSGDTASSLGYQTSYRAGAVFSYQLFKQLGTTLSGAYSRISFDDPLTSRDDDMTTLGAGLAWTPLKWLRIGLNYSFTDYRTTAAIRNDYQDNRVFLSVSLIPETPIRPDKALTRTEFEDRVFTPENYWKP